MMAQAGYWDDTFNYVGAATGAATVVCVVLVVTCMSCVAQRAWKKPVVRPGFMRVALSGGMKSVWWMFGTMSVLAVGGVVTMTLNVLDGVFSVVVGLTVVVVCAFVCAVVQWLSNPKAILAMDVQAGVIRYGIAGVRWRRGAVAAWWVVTRGGCGVQWCGGAGSCVARALQLPC